MRTSVAAYKENADRLDVGQQIPFEPRRGLECRVLS